MWLGLRSCDIWLLVAASLSEMIEARGELRGTVLKWSENGGGRREDELFFLLRRWYGCGRAHWPCRGAARLSFQKFTLATSVFGIRYGLNPLQTFWIHVRPSYIAPTCSTRTSSAEGGEQPEIVDCNYIIYWNRTFSKKTSAPTHSLRRSRQE